MPNNPQKDKKYFILGGIFLKTKDLLQIYYKTLYDFVTSS